MKNINIIKNRKIYLLAVALIFVLTAIPLIFFKTTINVSAVSTLDFDTYTDSDFYKYDGKNHSIHDYWHLNADKGCIRTGSVEFGVYDKLMLDLITYETNDPDDAIAQIVPRSLFTYTNNTLHIGNEYGFFISTTSMETNFKSTVMVFDVVTETNLKETDDVIFIKIIPVFQRRYAYLKSGSGLVHLYTKRIDNEPTIPLSIPHKLKYNNLPQSQIIAMPSLVTEYEYGFPTFQVDYEIYYDDVYDYYLKDISFVASLLNEQELNHNDTALGYTISDDNGMFITSFDYLFPGKYRVNNKFDNNAAFDTFLGTVSFILGQFRHPVAKVLSTVLDVGLIYFDAVKSVRYLENHEPYIWAEDGRKEFTIKNFKNTKGGQSNNYFDDEGKPMLIKTTGVLMNSSQNGSVWYGVGNKAEVAIQVSYSEIGGIPINNTRLIKDIAMKVVRLEDESEVAMATSSYATSVGEISYKEISPQVNKQDEIPDENSVTVYNFYGNTSRFKFTVPYSGNYEISLGNSSHYNYYSNFNTRSVKYYEAGTTEYFELNYRYDDATISTLNIRLVGADESESFNDYGLINRITNPVPKVYDIKPTKTATLI